MVILVIKCGCECDNKIRGTPWMTGNGRTSTSSPTNPKPQAAGGDLDGSGEERVEPLIMKVLLCCVRGAGRGRDSVNCASPCLRIGQLSRSLWR